MDGELRRSDAQGRYLVVGPVRPGAVVRVIFPIAERVDTIYVEKARYTIVRRGNEVVDIDPPGRYCPFFQRAYLRREETRWRKIERFVADERISW